MASEFKTSNQSLHFHGLEGQGTRFNFDNVHDGLSCQTEIFTDVKDIMSAVIEGNNACILSYGQTGSGKTHTLIGNMKSSVNKGLVPRAAQQLCQALKEPSPGCSLQLSMTVVEIYCERIRDLLVDGINNANLTITQDKVRGTMIVGATEAHVASEEEVLATMFQGLGNRAVASTQMNATSSRSHCIVTLMLKRRWDSTEDVAHSKLCLVDLAGSERADKTHAVAQTLEEGKLINKSLSSLGLVVNALTEGKAGAHMHIPYRDSKLTRALQDCLGGNAMTTMIICCSPSMENAAETLSSLRFGSR
ncbi:hypothetical protein WJX73_005839 [Symbiochloris irregularis]|uniref:Kinesin-like protein n=1 Tax=Symbiochloris irregularis TaxID=706552 RepID=A0AAW1P259_9CHLO